MAIHTDESGVTILISLAGAHRRKQVFWFAPSPGACHDYNLFIRPSLGEITKLFAGLQFYYKKALRQFLLTELRRTLQNCNVVNLLLHH